MAVASLLETKLQLPVILFLKAGTGSDLAGAQTRVLWWRVSLGTVTAMLQHQKRGTNIFINENLSAESSAIKNSQMLLFRQA